MDTALQRWGSVLLSQHAGLVDRDVQSALEIRKNAADERDATNNRMEDNKLSCPVCKGGVQQFQISHKKI